MSYQYINLHGKKKKRYLCFSSYRLLLINISFIIHGLHFACVCLNAVFNTDSNHSVIQTYNITTYKACDYDDAEDDDTIQWATGEPAVTTQPVSVAVPLVKEGMTYFFSSDYDGEQCKNGQHFKINVTHGQGLPNSLKSPSTDSSPAPSSSADDDSVPDTVIPSNFNNPVGGDEVKQASGSVSQAKFLCGEGGMLSSIVVCLGLVWAFG